MRKHILLVFIVIAIALGGCVYGEFDIPEETGKKKQPADAGQTNDDNEEDEDDEGDN